MAKKLYRSSKDKMIGGVAGGLADYFNIDPVILRILFVLLLFAWGASLFVYILFWIIVPLNPKQRFPLGIDNEKTTEAGLDPEFIQERKRNRRNVFAGILIAIGAIWLFGNIFPGFDMSWVIPLGLIGLGSYILYKEQLLTNESKVNHE